MKYRCVVIHTGDWNEEGGKEKGGKDPMIGRSAGKHQEMIREAPNKDALIRELASAERYILSIEPLSNDGQEENRSDQIKLSGKELLEFTESMALLFDSGLLIKDALGIAGMIFRNGRLSRAVRELNYYIERGNTLAEAMKAASIKVSPVFSGMVRIGEKMGNLNTVFPRLVSYLRTRKELKEKTINALIYPSLVFLIAVLGSLGIVFFLLPRMGEIFTGIRTETGEGSFAVMNRMQSVLPFILLVPPVLVVLGIVLYHCRSRDTARGLSLDRFFLRAPIVGRTLMSAECLTLTFALETLLGSGIPMEQALNESRGILTSPALREELDEIREQVVRGDSLSESFGRSGLFPDKMAGWILVGERTGRVREVFGQLRRYFEGEYEKFVSRFMNLIEPALIIGIGVFLLVLVMVYIVPLFSLYGSMV